MPRALVVEDDKAVRSLVETIVRRQGFEVETAVDGMDGLRKIQSSLKFDLVIIDLMMPNMDGITLLEKLREIGHDFTIFVMSAANDVFLSRLDGKQVTAVIRKPFDVQELGAIIRSALPGEPAADAAAIDGSVLLLPKQEEEGH